MLACKHCNELPMFCPVSTASGMRYFYRCIKCPQGLKPVQLRESQNEALDDWDRDNGFADFSIGARVHKCTGEARYSGWIVAAYKTRKGLPRYVIEVDPQGFQMICSPEQLTTRPA